MGHGGGIEKGQAWDRVRGVGRLASERPLVHSRRMKFSDSARIALVIVSTLAPMLVRAAEKGTDDPARRCFATIVKDPRAAIGQAHSLYDAGDTVAARRCLGDALVASGEAPRGARVLEELAREISAASDADPETQGAVWGDAGRAWLEADDLGRATAAFDAAIARRPGDLQLKVDRAVALGSARRFWEAIDDLTAAIDGGVETTEVYLLRATAWREVGTAELAMEDIQHAAALEPNDAGVLLERGRIRKLANDTTGAQNDFLAVLKRAPGTDAAAAARHEIEALSARPRHP